MVYDCLSTEVCYFTNLSCVKVSEITFILDCITAHHLLFFVRTNQSHFNTKGLFDGRRTFNI